MELDNKFYSGFDPVAISDKISVFNHAKHREVQLRCAKMINPSANFELKGVAKFNFAVLRNNTSKYSLNTLRLH